MFKQTIFCSALVGPAPRRIALTAAITIGFTSYLPAQVNFISSQSIPANVCTGLFAGHFNNDAKSDFLASCRPGFPAGSGPTNAALLNNGNGTYTNVGDTAANSEFLMPMLVTDLNGDGISDLVLLNEGNTGFQVQLGNPDGTFRVPNSVPGLGGNVIVAGDFLGNGRTDLASIDTSAGGALEIALNKGDGTFQKGNSYALNATPSTQYLLLSSGDINGDGKADLAVVYGGTSGTVVPYFSSGNGAFVKGSTFAVGNSPGPAAIARLNSDAYGDLAIPTSTGVTILFGSPSGALTAGHTIPYQSPSGVTGFGANLQLADVSKDGKTDMVFAGLNLVYVYKGNGDGTFATPAVYSVPGPGLLTLADTTGSGKLDIAAVGTLGGSGNVAASIGLLANDGKGNFRAAPNTYSALAAGIVSGDFNRDGKRDVAVVNTPACKAPCNGKVTVFPGSGSTFFNAGTQYTIGMHGMAIAAGDLNGDGVSDLVVTNGTPGDNADVSILLGVKTGGFQPAHNFRLGSLSNDAFLVDMNHDGKLDLVEDGGIALGDGKGSFGDLIPFPDGIAFGDLSLPSAPHYFTTHIGVGDFNGDGILDIAAAMSTDVWVLLGDGTGHFTGTQLSSDDVQQAIGIVVGKLHGGTVSDIVVESQNTFDGGGVNEAFYFKGNGNGTFQGGVSLVGTDQSLAGAVAIGDFNHDGKNDVALSSASDVLVLLGNGDGTFNVGGGGDITSGPLQLAGATTNSVGYVAVSDFNGDGLPDMIFTNDHGLSRLYSVPTPNVSPTSLRWSPSNDTAVQVLTIKNITTTAQSVRAIIGDPAQSEYQITSNTCGSSLAVGSTCKVSIKHNGGAGRPFDTLYVSDNSFIIANVSLQATD